MKNDLVATVVVEGPFEVETEPYTIKADTGSGLLSSPTSEDDDEGGNNLFVVLIIGAAVAGFVAAGKVIKSRKG